jgi:hypothetical protein
VGTAQEIKAAIQKLSDVERKELLAELLKVLPELDGDAAWERIIRDPRPRRALSSLLDETEAEHSGNPTAFAEISDREFDRRS